MLAILNFGLTLVIVLYKSSSQGYKDKRHYEKNTIQSKYTHTKSDQAYHIEIFVLIFLFKIYIFVKIYNN